MRILKLEQECKTAPHHFVPRETPGLNIVRCNETLGCRFMNNGEIELVDCIIPPENLLIEHKALPSAGVYFKPGKIIQASKNLGVGQAALERTAEFVQTYSRGGKLLIKHQAVASRLADMATRVAAIGSVMQAQNQLTKKVLMQKLYATWQKFTPLKKF